MAHLSSSRPMPVTCHPHFSPAAWVEQVLNAAGVRHALCVLERLLGALLHLRYSSQVLSRVEHGAGSSAYAIGSTVYRVDLAATPELIGNAVLDLRDDKTTLLLVPYAEAQELRTSLEVAGLEGRVIVLPLETSMAQTIIGLAADAGRPAIEVFQEIIEVYNRRVAEAEADRSLLIELDWSAPL